jgi:hypothetical protein
VNKSRLEKFMFASMKRDNRVKGSERTKESAICHPGSPSGPSCLTSERALSRYGLEDHPNNPSCVHRVVFLVDTTITPNVMLVTLSQNTPSRPEAATKWEESKIL